MTRRGTELLDLPTLATSKEGRTAVWLKVSNDTERVWLTARHEVIVEVKVGNRWSVADRYHLSDAHAAAALVFHKHFKFQGCRSCQEGGLAIQRDWRFCPHCSAPIQRRGRARHRPTSS